MLPERRNTPRSRTLLGGRVAFNNQHSTLDCTVRNLSSDGALLLLSEMIALPAAFDLEVPHRQRSYTAHVRWRARGRVGVAFETQPEAEIVPLDMARRLKNCEQDNARLKTRIRQLTEAG